VRRVWRGVGGGGGGGGGGPRPPPASSSRSGYPTVAELPARALRREIRWGVFQGILLFGIIALAVYLVIVVVLFAAVAGISGS
jgi:hypothetical protein